MEILRFTCISIVLNDVLFEVGESKNVIGVAVFYRHVKPKLLCGCRNRSSECVNLEKTSEICESPEDFAWKNCISPAFL